MVDQPALPVLEPSPFVPPLRVPAAVRPRARRPPASLACLRCQLLGRRRLGCAEADRCAALPRPHPLGPVLLAAWAAIALAFLASVW